MCINCTERVIQQINVCIIVDGSCQLNPLFLTSTHVQSSLTNLCQVSVVEIFDILVQGTRFDCLLIQFLVERLPEEYIIANSPALYPGVLRNICHRAKYLNLQKKTLFLAITLLHSFT